MNPILSELHRGGKPESVHRGCIAVFSPAGRILEFGEAGATVFPRSALKPLQLLPLVELGVDRDLQLPPKQLAILCASHSGDSHHVKEVTAILAKANIPKDALQCGAHPPFDAHAQAELHRASQPPTPLHNNCSGKHTGMLLLAQKLKAPLENYLEPDHPVQQTLKSTIAALTELEPESMHFGIDGCSAPAWGLPLASLAKAFQNLTDAKKHSARRNAAIERIFAAVIAEPHYLSGKRQLDQALIRAARPRLLAKRGAEGILAMAVQNERGAGYGIAMKVDDGATRGYYRPAFALLDKLGVTLERVGEHLPDSADGVVLNHRRLKVGELCIGAELKTHLDVGEWP